MCFVFFITAAMGEGNMQEFNIQFKHEYDTWRSKKKIVPM